MAESDILAALALAFSKRLHSGGLGIAAPRSSIFGNNYLRFKVMQSKTSELSRSANVPSRKENQSCCERQERINQAALEKRENFDR
ncbi:uncharacterized protein UTRI_03612 [Ustilago trichophora]|uniref:Uncharacterized protein n=1 Tax=Ustilago trichophora TaxID=86804 RepID=A0A5C3E0W2_9BASI|nr:uncharacterized protein UTRI_03612 [Ustilago trichophora]